MIMFYIYPVNANNPDIYTRFATQPYTMKSSSLKNTKIHLTNYSINKKADNFVKNTDAAADGLVRLSVCVCVCVSVSLSPSLSLNLSKKLY